MKLKKTTTHIITGEKGDWKKRQFEEYNQLTDFYTKNGKPIGKSNMQKYLYMPREIDEQEAKKWQAK